MTGSASSGCDSSRPAGTESGEPVVRQAVPASAATTDSGPGQVARPAGEPAFVQEQPADDEYEPL
jgi:hypothetical protein